MAFAPPPYPLCFIFFLVIIIYSVVLPFSILAQTQTVLKNVSLGSSLTATNNDNINSFWASPSKEFAFGFQEIEKDGFLLAIWFNKIPQRTIVWSANGNDLVPAGSKLELATDGQLALKASNGERIYWKAVSSDSGSVAYAAMLDSGNFVLANRDSVYLWQSFNQPTDTILPAQTLINAGNTLLSRYMETNYSGGRYLLELKQGNLELSVRYAPLDFVFYSYYKSATATQAGNADQLIFNQSGSIYLKSKNGSTIHMISSNKASQQDFYQRAILEYDGVFRHYVYPKSNMSIGRWPMEWSSISDLPSNICLMKTGNEGDDRGVGPCGFNSYCRLDQGRPHCQCPQGYSFVDPHDVSLGCSHNLNFVSQICADKESPETNLFYFEEMQNGDWAYSEYEHLQGVTEDYCRHHCLGDCFCAAATFNDGNCTKKKSPLSNGRIDPSIDGKTLVKVRKNHTNSTGAEDDLSSTLILVGTILLSSSAFLNLLLLVATFVVIRTSYRKRRMMLEPCNVVFPGQNNLRFFTYKEIKESTNEFNEQQLIGSSSGFAKVFKGVLTSSSGNGNFVAVKMFDKMVTESDREFKAEVSAIGRTNHRNLVQLLGFCNEGQHLILVYEFMEKGSLVNFFSRDSTIDWYGRIRIASETARGLLYLHEECSTQIIHCNIKPPNILLDGNFTAKISDFGLAKFLNTEQSLTPTSIRGTKGYIAPEWFRNMPITVKVDVYSFGILLLELICCRRSIELNAEDENEMVLADWAYDCYKDGKLDLLVKYDKEATDDMKSVEKFVKIAIWCIQEEPSLRPNMKKVTQMLEGTVQVSIPPDPASFISSIF